jgi:hypothetical protein
MIEIMEMFKRLGPNYELNWRIIYFGPDKSLVMTLIYLNPLFNIRLQHEHAIPFENIEMLDSYAPRILEDMGRRVEDELRNQWGAMK